MVGSGGGVPQSIQPAKSLEEDDDDAFDYKRTIYQQNQEELRKYQDQQLRNQAKEAKKEERRLAKQAEHEAKVMEHQKTKQQKEIEKLAKQQGKTDKQVQTINNNINDNKEDHKGKGGGKGKKGGKGKPINQDSIDKTVGQKLQNDVDNKDQQVQTEDKVDLAVLGVAACAVLLFVYFAARR
jgi:hypothetical protein